MNACQKKHRYKPDFSSLPDDQGGHGRHRCAGCAYDAGFEQGKRREEDIKMELDSFPSSQAGEVRHKSPHAAFAKGYYDGVAESYSK